MTARNGNNVTCVDVVKRPVTRNDRPAGTTSASLLAPQIRVVTFACALVTAALSDGSEAVAVAAQTMAPTSAMIVVRREIALVRHIVRKP
jgi:hypothetical protein